LVRLALGRSRAGDEKCAEGLSEADWREVIEQAFAQGVSAASAEGLRMAGVPEVLESPALEGPKYEWLASVLQVEGNYRRQWQAAARMGGIFAGAGVRAYVLKGFAVSGLYPIPEHRECGDCDVWLGSDYELGNRLMEQDGVKVSRSYYKNSTFVFDSLMVENHRFCTPVRGGHRRKAYERYLQSIISDGAVQIPGLQMWRPGPMFNALFLTSHAMGHFVSEGGITLRHLIDWDLAMDELRRASGFSGDVPAEFEARCREFGLWKFACALRDRDELLMDEILHPTVPQVEFSRGWCSRLQLVRVMFGSRWKYRRYTDSSFALEFLRTAFAFCFDRHPNL